MENLPKLIDWESAEQRALIKNTCAKDLNDMEFAMFMGLAKATGLNPFKKEIWAWKDKQGRVITTTGINGFYAVANAHPQYDGMSEPEYGVENGEMYCKVAVYRKDRSRPQVAKIYMKEFNKGYAMWIPMPRYMLSKTAEAIALRKSFPQELNDIYSTDEIPQGAPVVVRQKQSKAKIAVEPKPVDDSDLFEPGPEPTAPDWEAFKYRYHLPFKKKGVDGKLINMAAVRAEATKRGWIFNKVDECWYTNEYSEVWSKYIRPLNAEKAQDNIPKAVLDAFPGSTETPLGDQIDGSGDEVEAA